MLPLVLLLAAATPAQAAPRPVKAPAPAIVTTASGLRFQTLVPGNGARPGPDKAVLVRYEGRLADGTVFDKSEEPVGLPVSDVIPGFSEALQMMNVGGTYRFWIPPLLAYGAEGRDNVPPNSVLEFTVTLLRVGRAAAPPAPAQP